MTFSLEELDITNLPFEKLEIAKFPLEKLETSEFPLEKGVRGIFNGIHKLLP